MGSLRIRRCSEEGGQGGANSAMSSTRLKERLEEAKNTFKSIKRQCLEEELTARSQQFSSRPFFLKKHLR